MNPGTYTAVAIAAFSKNDPMAPHKLWMINKQSFVLIDYWTMFKPYGCVDYKHHHKKHKGNYHSPDEECNEEDEEEDEYEYDNNDYKYEGKNKDEDEDEDKDEK